MRIAIIGTGNVGGSLATAAIATGHQVSVAAAHHEHAVKLAGDTGATAAETPAEAAVDADVVVLAVPAGAAVDVLDQLGDAVTGKVVIDATNPLNESYTELTTSGNSHVEALVAAAPQARVVKAFNTVFASRLTNTSEDGQPLDGFYAGDDESAKATVAELLASLGFRPVDVGGLRMARSLEELALLNITINAHNEWAWQSAWQLTGPTTA
ncbi:NADPH-dependent F420 reductase [Kibdelosporangium aridum]|uniref:Pyrroline-5-carboxylate reductase catalytic N-terminal domain-containing protein n=1 Tax=Kibdelosporangium aridum TaxID=2030 RepID=A0A1W2FX13_KIBAR|nr:NAD(P)-binding domain-containing protein [Kibdelosporangium aridum]SMD26431.1 hypothetical protein SAMN05661093_10014 [Kibdelosporangium aridum]